jgi:parallel beta-helix repeat protein
MLILLLGLSLLGCGGPEAPDFTGGERLLVLPWDDAEYDDPAAIQTFSTICSGSIQSCIDAASSGDEVTVAGGVYSENLTFKSGVDVVGAGRTEVYVYGTADGTGVSSMSVSGMTFVDPDYVASGSAYLNHGIVLDGATDVTLSDVGVHYFDDGIRVLASAGITIDDCAVWYDWYGIYVEDSTAVQISNNLIASNAAGGVATWNGVAADIVHNTVIGNAYASSTEYLAGAIATGTGGSETVANNIIVSNYHGYNCYSCLGNASHNLIWGNTENYTNDASSGSGDLNTDPLFNNPAEGDYTLSSSSPAIDAGTSLYTVATDSQGESRPQGSGVDMGMDEYASSAYDLLMTEVMSNAKIETVGEFVEIYNAGSGSVNLNGFVLTDGDDIDYLEAFDGGGTVLAAGEYAVIVDPDYDGSYNIDASVTVLTTGDTTVGNGLTTSDLVLLYEADGTTIAASFSHPFDPGDGISAELYNYDNGDVNGNWRTSQCTDGSSPGATHCFPESGDPGDLVITEVMANPLDESTGEFFFFNDTATTEIDVSGLVLTDNLSGTSANFDIISGFQGGSTLLNPGEHAVILDPGYAYEYWLATATLLLVVDDAQLGNGLTPGDTVWLLEADASTQIDSFTPPGTAANGVSYERIDYSLGDESSNWIATTDSCGGWTNSVGRLNGATGGTCQPIQINEVMANALDEDTGEFVELFNSGADSVDLAGLILSDGDQDDTLTAYEGGSTVLPSGGFALIIDVEYAGEYTLDSSVILVTTEDTTLGNSLSVADEIWLYETDGTSVIDAFRFPQNPGNGVSTERIDLILLDAVDAANNWTASTCASGSSPGASNCVSGATTAASVSALDLVISEVMSNPLDEDTGEFVEIYNAGSDDVDLLWFVVYDGDALDTIIGLVEYYDTVLVPGQFAVILDAEYAGDYPDMPADTLLLTTDDTTIASGLSTNDPVYLYESNAVSLIDSFSYPENPGNGISIEKIDLAGGDTEDNWAAPTNCSSSPGDVSCL